MTTPTSPKDVGGDKTQPNSATGSVTDAGNIEEIIVNFDGPDDPANPKNWPYANRWRATLIVSLFTFVSPVCSSMIAPGSSNLAREFGITSETEIALTISVFVLAFGPLSEIYGRSRVIQISNIFFFAWNLGCGFSQSKAQLIVFRFFAGLGGSAPLTVGAGVLADIWRPEERGKAIAIYSLAPLMGPVLGPVAGAWISERTTWRWVFWSTSIFDIAVQALGLFYLRESYAPLLLDRKAAQIRASRAADPEKGGTPVNVRTVFDKSEPRTWQHIFSKALIRPFAIFVREPIIQVVGLYMAFVYGVFYREPRFLIIPPCIHFSDFSLPDNDPTIFRDVYHQSTGIAGLHYFALGIGLTCASQVNARVMDKVYVHFKNKNGGIGEPEFRVRECFCGSLPIYRLLTCFLCHSLHGSWVYYSAVGLLITGWCAEKGVHWAVTDIGIACVGAGIILNFQSMTTYVVDAFTLFAASALAAVRVPAVCPAMYNSLGYGKGDTVLAVVSIVIGCPAPFLFWKYGKAIRMRSRYIKKR
ncbi:MFS polyamine transporter [Hymenopellis radicata]|nr:MFS polyamine transporter [Hymenopellis radicata]